ncbi:MAG: hypothetical protein ACLRTA_09015 [Clostridia bacterium]
MSKRDIDISDNNRRTILKCRKSIKARKDERKIIDFGKNKKEWLSAIYIMNENPNPQLCWGEWSKQ